MPTNSNDSSHYDWLIKNRYRNQCSAVKLFRLLDSNRVLLLKTKGQLRYDAQTLVAINFSLWRAVFLAGRSSSGNDTAEHTEKFLREVIENNAILYIHDKASKNWTFNYYAANARYRLKEYKEKNEDFVVDDSLLETGSRLPAKRRWEEFQRALDNAISHFERRLRRPSKL